MTENELYKELIEEKLENFRLQQGRLVSDWKSEKENRELLSQRVEDAMKIMHELNAFKTDQYKKLEQFDTILRNGGNGLVMQVDRLNQARDGNKGRLTFFVSIAAVVLSLLDLILHFKQIVMKILMLLLFPVLSFAQPQIEVPLMKPCPYGYLEFIPSCETVTENCNVVYRCPHALLINLIGFGERGNGTTELYKAANAGVSRLIKDGQWTRKEFIVITPQLPSGYNMYSPKTLNIFIKQMIAKYPIDTTEIYVVGLSGGANSIYPYIGTYKGVRGVVAISGYGASKFGPLANKNGTKVWEFHGEMDSLVPYSMAFHKAYVMSDTAMTDNARFTGWPGVAHYGWQEVYSGKWLDKEYVNDPFNENVFDWLLK